MLDEQTFQCQQCKGYGPINGLRHRQTMAGDYCAVCANEERCAACGEMFPMGFMVFKDDIKNYVCEDCQHDYQAVAKYIKPLPVFTIKLPKNKAA